jgi:hypothetical protein
MDNAEANRLKEDNEHTKDWKKWGSYLSEREWGTVREDYSADGKPWEYFPHEHARSRTYRWGEDGIAGISDDQQHLCFGLALWNGQDPILKERLFGLTNGQGNHGEDVKELYYHLDNTPTHSYMKYLYKYPQEAFPYDELVQANQDRGKSDPEYELIDTGIFDDNRYFDVFVEYAKEGPEDILISITVANRGPEDAPIELIPSLWFRNTWAWRKEKKRANISADTSQGAPFLKAEHPEFDDYRLYFQASDDKEPELLFTDNETNKELIFENDENVTPFVKDGINNYIISGAETVNPEKNGTKAAIRYRKTVPAGESHTVRLVLTKNKSETPDFDEGFSEILDQRKQEADTFYGDLAPEGITDDMRSVQRQALAGLLWNKQFYRYSVRKWLEGDPTQPDPPQSRKNGRNNDWIYLSNKDIISMPDSWEYPWYASWDLAFHCIPMAVVDPEFAKNQLVLMLREWYMNPNGQIPSYEWSLGDATPPVHAWAALRVFRIEKKKTGEGDFNFLQQVFHKLLINFTWWINREDSDDRNVFQGGFLGLDNIGVFDRSEELPNDAHLDQSDATSWMAMYCLNMLSIAMELATKDNAYEGVATKFLEHFFYIAHAINERPDASLFAENDIDLWNEEDEFFYDVIHFQDGKQIDLKVRSLVGLIPLFAVTTIDSHLLDDLPGFKHRLEWFLEHRPDLTNKIASVTKDGAGHRRLLSVVNQDRLRSILARMLDENEFLSPYGIRSLSKYHKDHPYSLNLEGKEYTISYRPAESHSGMFGGNSNWRGPVWFPINYLLIESLQKFDYYYDDNFEIEFPTGSGNEITLWDVAGKLSNRLIKIFLKDEDGHRAVYGGSDKFQTDPHFRDHVLFYEYFHGDNGAGLGASHQTGWTALVAKLIQQSQTDSHVDSDVSADDYKESQGE